MRIKIFLRMLILALCTFFTGCEKTGSVPDNNNPVTSQPSGNKISSASTMTPDNTQSPAGDTTKEPVQQETSPAPGIRIAKLSSSKDYSDAYRMVKVLGLKEYKTIKNNDYTDKADKGKKFLVLFLSVKNNSYEEDYINYNYISAKVDGKKTEHTFLVNEPKGYPTIFTQIPANGNIAGFIVWEVPSGWNKLELTYNGWKDINNVSLEAEFTPEDLSDPLIYNINDYN